MDANPPTPHPRVVMISRCHFHILQALIRWVRTKLECDGQDRESFTKMTISLYIGVQAQPTVVRALCIMNEILRLLKAQHWADLCKTNHAELLCSPCSSQMTPGCAKKVSEFTKQEAVRIQ